MTEEQKEIWKKAAELGAVPDALNPIFLFSLTHTHLLVRLIQGEIDAMEIAKYELECRGLDLTGQWVGFKKDQMKDRQTKKAPKIRRKL